MTTLTLPVATALALFAFSASITPGPNNTMLLASGANFGFRRTMPHAAGVLVGFLTLIVICGLGLGGVFDAFPLLHALLKWGGVAYLLYLSIKIATASGVGRRKVGDKPLSFRQAFAFQAINPKGWAMALGAVATYLPRGYGRLELALAVAICGALNGPCILTWAAFGVGIRRFLDRPVVLRAFNIVMGSLLALSLLPLLFER